MKNTKTRAFSVGTAGERRLVMEAGVNREQKARDLMAAIRYQVFRPEVTTMGRCPRCGGSSRGSGVCAVCLGLEIESLVGGTDVGTAYTTACFRQRDAERAVLDALKRRNPPDSSISAHVATGDC